jgi:hypothetical protein
VLAQAAKRDKVQPLGSVGMGSGDNNLSYISRYDLELFVVAPALQRFAPDRATSLLTQSRYSLPHCGLFPEDCMPPDGPVRAGWNLGLRRASRAVHRGELQSSVARAAALSAAPAVTPAPTVALALWA